MTYWIRVDGYVLPAPVGDHPALELCNTLAGWRSPSPRRREYLRTYDHLAVLARHSGTMDADRTAAVLRRAQRRPAEADEALARAQSVRTDLYAVMAGTPTVAGRRRFLAAVEGAHRREVLTEAPDGGHRWQLGGGPSLTDPLDALLTSAGELLTASPSARIGVCPGRGCGWLFLNPTGRRRWCQMAVCGNRAKQARRATQ